VTASADLLADRGAAAAAEDFFRSPEFLDAEGVTHTLRIRADGCELLAPVIVREIDGGPELDATSPYGYPGIVPSGRASSRHAEGHAASKEPIDAGAVDFSSTGLVSAFIRHTLDEPPALAGAVERNLVQVADPELPRKQRSSDRNQINRNRRNGYRTRLVTGRESSRTERAGFLEAYEQTMRRADAGERYFFGAPYFDRIMEADGTWLALALSPEGQVAAASIAVRSDGYLHYYLSGSADSHLRVAPMKNVVTRLVEHAIELGLPLNLGGGIAPGDALEEFKRGFANRRQAWLTSELICDESAYAELSAGRPRDGFFPAYRA